MMRSLATARRGMRWLLAVALTLGCGRATRAPLIERSLALAVGDLDGGSDDATAATFLDGADADAPIDSNAATVVSDAIVVDDGGGPGPGPGPDPDHSARADALLEASAPMDVGGGVASVGDAGDAAPEPPRAIDAGPPRYGPAFVDLTWMSIANIYYEMGSLGVLTDGYITRIPAGNFFGGSQGLAFTHSRSVPDRAAVKQVLDSLGGGARVNLLLTGHSHFDHSFDTATWSSLTNAPIIGSRTTCFQTVAQGIPADRCRIVVGAETIVLADGITMRVVRWNHSGDPVTNPDQHPAAELAAPPAPDPITGGLRAGVAEDFPNGGGGRGFLFRVDGRDGPFSWFYQNSAGPTDLRVPIVEDGVDYGAPLANLQSAMVDAGLDRVDLWIGTGGAAVARLVVPVINPKAYLPIHWDGLSGAFLAGVARPFTDASLAAFLAGSGITLLTPRQYMDKWRLDRDGVRSVANDAVKQALGFAP